MKLVRLFLILFVAFFTTPSRADTFRLGLLHADPEIFSYEISVIELALKTTDPDHQLELIPLANTSQERVLNMLENRQNIDMFFTGYSRERELRFLQIDIPLTRGLLGARVFIRKKGERFVINNLSDLQRHTIGSGIGWPDTTIFESAGFDVISSTYDNLWRMLNHGRFRLFNRGINEAYVEIDQQARKGYDFEIQPDVILFYPFDYFIYLNRESTALKDILESGLRTAYENGSFMSNFNTHPNTAKALKKIQSFSKVFQIPNPLLSRRVKNIPARFWHNPVQ
ncbi:hypothetical protein RYZ26_00470 [Terasakiella sp. A23]|uniref:hypothetical protein n=1 Tax=Terasakiella sp. FCG-A23 TaxID=3080561 RepID=UPI00295430AE|nr:hypothetical protein [Terasakiella sp. A23]MDV7338047.1 hypothetical protein [Terasakiella sp. A23]